ncbi:YpjP family protein [Metabacillus sp. 84]|uniref:YpjP family protein n=1 Tax=unclassified Metabacillus TaxID=2675274 RepID=UPI003CE80D32
MNKWLKKTLVALFSIATLGMVAPPASLIAEEKTGSLSETLSENQYDSELKGQEERAHQEFKDLAREQTYLKFGDRIRPVIEREFDELILPKITEAIDWELTAVESDSLVISEKPGGGRSEKIFHIYDARTGKDVIRFHVRIDHPPGEGFWFNFHYHLDKDSFEKHHELGSIYWDRNTPPAWMTH